MTLVLVAAACFQAAPAGAQDLNWSVDVGAVGTAGDSSFDAATGAYHIKGAGVGLAGTADAFHFAYYEVVRGDGQMVVRVSSADALAQVALVIRESLDPGAASAAGVVRNGSAQFFRRAVTGNNAITSGSTAINVPCWLKLVRSGSTITTFVSADSQTWTSLGNGAMTLGASTVYVGFAVSNGVSGASGTNMASFDSIQSSFLPDEGLALWLKADAGITQDATGRVSVWADQSGNGMDASQATYANQPQVVAATFNGQPAIHFDGSNGYLQLPSGFGDFTQGITALVVARPSAAGSWQRLFELANGPSVDSVVFCRYGDSEQLRFECVNGNGNLAAGVNSNGGVLALNTTQLFGFSQNNANGTATLYKNGQALTTQAAGPIVNTTRASNFVARSNFSNPFFAGDIAEIVLFNRVLSDAQRQAWESYLNTKYAYAAPPPVPTQLVATMLSGTQIALSWSEDPSATVTGYQLERQNTDGTWSIIALLGPDTFSYIDNAVTAGTVYRYRVSALNNYGPSALSPSTAFVTNPNIGQATFPTSGMQLWLRADLGVRTDASGGVSIWSDQAGGNHIASQGNASSRPILVAGDINGRPALRFDGNNDRFDTDFVGMGGQGLTFFVVTKGTNYQSLVRLQNGNGYLVYPWGNHCFIDDRDGATGNGVDSGLVPGQWNLAAVTYQSSGQMASYCNGSLVASRPANGQDLPGSMPLMLGSYGNGEFAATDLAEVLIYNHSLSNAERQAVEAYLNTKYQIVLPPVAPTQVTVSPLSSTQLLLTWSESSTLVGGYVVEKQAPDGSWLVVATLGEDASSYVDASLSAGTTCTYRVTATSNRGDSPASAATAGTTNADGASLPLAGLQLWLNASTGTTINANNGVNVWRDALSGRSASQNNAASCPTLVSATLNGHPAIHFDGTNSYLNLPGSVFNGLAAADVFVVLRSAVVSGGQYGLWRFTDRENAFYPEGDHLCETFGTYNRYGFNLPQVPLNQFNLYNVSAAAGAWTARMDGRVLFSSTSNTVDFNAGSYLLGQTRDGQRFAGDIAEVLLFDHVLTDGERQAVAEHMATKYNLAEASAAPSNLAAQAIDPTQVSLSWQYAQTGGGTYFDVERSIVGSNDFQLVGSTTDATSFFDSTVQSGTSYTYRVTAANWGGSVSAASNEAQVTTSTSGAILPVSSLRLWLSADALFSGSVPRWTDQSGNGNDAVQTNTGNQPTRLEAAPNSRPAAHFDGTNSYLNLPGSVFSGLTAADMFVVLRTPNPPSGQRGLWRFTDRENAFYPEGDHLCETFGTYNRYTFGFPEVPLSQFNLYNVSAAGGTWVARMNNQVLFSSTSNTVDFNAGSYLLGQTRDGQRFAGDIAEVLLFDHVLTDGERQAVQRYCVLRHKLLAFLGEDPDADPDGDGLTNYQEYVAGTDPLDYYNGQARKMSIVSGNNQPGNAGMFVAQPLRVEVTNAVGVSLVNAPVSFSVTRADGLLAVVGNPAVLSSTITVRTDSNGIAAALFRAPASPLLITSLVRATAGGGSLATWTTFAEAFVGNDNISGDGIPDWWKVQYGYDLTANNASADPDGDGLTNMQEFLLGTNPNVPDATPEGVPYNWMLAKGLDPRFDSLDAIDPNGSGLTYLQEYQLEQSTVDFWRFDEGQQSTVTMSSAGRKDIGTLLNNPVRTADPDGASALLFNQTGAQVDVADPVDGHLDFGVSQSFSIAARFQTSNVGASRLVGKGSGDDGASGYRVGVDQGRITMGVGAASAQSPALRFRTSAAFNDGQWHHVAAIFDRTNSQACLYVDGILQPVTIDGGSVGASQGTVVAFDPATALSASQSNAAFAIGARDPGGAESFAGSIDNVGLFSKALTQAEVRSLAGKQGNTPPTVIISSPVPGAEFPEGGTVTIQAQASSATASITKIEAFDGAIKLGEASMYPYTMPWIQVSAGSHTLIAKATDTRGASTISAPVSIVVSADSDHDGLPDWWELRYFSSLDQTAVSSYLNDGFSNLVKYQFGLDPTKPIASDSNNATGLTVFTPLH